MAVLITGGAGYIGSVTVDLLRARGEDVVVLDDVVRGHRSAVAPDVPFYKGRIGDRALVARILAERSIDACVHFAALAYVGESVSEPGRYYANNVAEGLALTETLIAGGVRRFVFSSTCATYGEPEQVPIPESHPQWPVNPYGWSKLMVERILHDFDAAHGLKFVALRYFNAAGATAARGEHHTPESHLIPLVLDTARGRRPHISIFGTDYPTPDGTAIRDYIHVSDLGMAHLQALTYLRGGGVSECVNLGTGRGHSVLEVIETAGRVTGRHIEAKREGRRAGDPARLIAVSEKARRVLGWEPQLGALATIIGSAWEWQQAHPDGYPD
jgi:UDP-glucose 4-epimerase